MVTLDEGKLIKTQTLVHCWSRPWVTAVTALGAIGREDRWQQRGKGMPILLMALLALLVFGVIGILLAAAVVVENSKRARIARGNAAHSV